MTNSALYTHKNHDFNVQITHWDYFFVNRQSGRTAKNWCRFQVLDGERKGEVYEAAIPYFLSIYNPVGL